MVTLLMTEEYAEIRDTLESSFAFIELTLQLSPESGPGQNQTGRGRQAGKH
ncbi:hypothetical protein [Buchananella hordeovulneris]|uniref:hypothetical protein n=1 Tax=Buchananella hordeovulneris TaxID=52770 RepID=UPI0026DCF891|nr:hypothetical protein [Buchananella hordeovulneris]MDO5079860.1 hypothetical protein [Buchananella hordeovulneris]